MSTNRATLIGAGLLVCVLFGSGCANYYKVRDPQSGRVYYTQDLKQRTSGTVTLKDGKSGDEVSVQNSEVKKITKDQYDSARMTSGQNPQAEAEKKALAEKQAAEAKAAQQKAEQQAAEARAAQEKAAADAKAAETKAAQAKAAQAKAANSPQQFRTSLLAGKAQVDRTLQSLTALTSPTQADLQTAYKNFGQQVDLMKQHAAQAKVDSDAMRQSREAYFAKWDQRVAQTDNPTIRAEADAMRTRLRTEQEKLIADAALTKETYDPFITDLEDTQKFLAGGLTNDAVAALGPTVKKAQENGKLLKQRIDTLIADIDSIAGKPATQPSGATATPPKE